MPDFSDISAIRAGQAYIEIGTRDSALVAGLARAAQRLKRFGAAIRGIGLQVGGAGAAIFAPLATAAQSYANQGEELIRASQRTGMSAEALSTLGQAAKQSGVDFDSLQLAIARMSRSLVEAARGESPEVGIALQQLNLSLADLNNLSQEDRFKLIADRLSQLPDPAARAATAMQIFGRGAAELLPLLDLGSKGITRQQELFRSLGLQWSTQDATSAALLAAVMRTMWDVLQRGAQVVGSAVAPVLEKIALDVIRVTVAATDFIRRHGEMVATVAAVALGFVAAGAALVVFGTLLQSAGIVLGTIGAACGLVVEAVAAIASPVGLVIAAIAGGVAAFLYFSDTGAKVGNSIVKAFHRIWEAIKFVFDNTTTPTDAWAAVQTETGLYIMQAWARVEHFLVNLWLEFRSFLSGLWIGIKSEISEITLEISSVLVTAAYRMTDSFLTIWVKAMQAWRAIVVGTGTVIGEDMARFEAMQAFGHKYRDRALTHKDAVSLAEDEFALGHPDNPNQGQLAYATRRSEEIWKKYGGQSFNAGGSLDAFVYSLVQKAGDNAAARSLSVNPQDRAEDAALAKRLKDLKAEADARQKYLQDLYNKQREMDAAAAADAKARNDEELAEAKRKNDQALADAIESAKKAREAFEKELGKAHAASGQKSLTDQLNALLAPLSGVAGGDDLLKKIKAAITGTDGALGEDGLGGGVGPTTTGAFEIANQAVAKELWGGRSGASTAERIAKATERTAANTDPTTWHSATGGKPLDLPASDRDGGPSITPEMQAEWRRRNAESDIPNGPLAPLFGATFDDQIGNLGTIIRDGMAGASHLLQSMPDTSGLLQGVNAAASAISPGMGILTDGLMKLFGKSGKGQDNGDVVSELQKSNMYLDRIASKPGPTFS